MARKKETAIDTKWEEMKDFAVEQQQCFYELLSDYTIYESDQHKYLKQNIGYAIYGPPKNNEDTSIMESNSNSHCKPENLNNVDVDVDVDADADVDITDAMDYDKKAQEIIDQIYKKICKYSIKPDSQPIYFGIFYVIIFRCQKNVKKKIKTEVKEKVKKEAKQEIETEIKEVNENKKKPLVISSLPIFKIRRSVQKKSNSTKSTEQKENTSTEVEADYETWYIDITRKVYKSWIDFKENIHLPECTMVVPKDGFYQPDPSLPITEDYSTVWVEIMDSPACALKTKIFNGIDIGSDIVASGVSLGTKIASIFVPIGPVVTITEFVIDNASKIWHTGRTTQQTVHQFKHGLSYDKKFSHYVYLNSTSLKTTSTHAKTAFNTMLGNKIFLFGMEYPGYFAKDKYQTEQSFSYLDTLYFATYLMFFAGSVVNLQFADDIIKSTQGKVLDNCGEILRCKRLRKKFNRATEKVTENNTRKICENADVICYIKNHEQLQPDQLVGNLTLDKTSSNIVWSFEQGKIRVSDIVLLDPIKFVNHFIQSGKLAETNQSNPSGSQNCSDNFIADQLEKALCDLLSKFYTNDACSTSKKLSVQSDFEPLIKEMSSMNIDEEYLKKLFDIVIKLTRHYKDKEDFLLSSLTFIWQYCKANLNEWGIKSCYRMQSDSGCRILQKIITVVSEAINMMLENLDSAFLIYMEALPAPYVLCTSL